MIAQDGMGKRTKVADFPIQKRAGLGVIAMKVTARTGDVVCAGVVETSDDLIFISAKGIVMRTKVDALRIIGRATQGVIIMRMDDGDRVASYARVPAGADENGIVTGGVEPAAPEPAEAPKRRKVVDTRTRPRRRRRRLIEPGRTAKANARTREKWEDRRTTKSSILVLISLFASFAPLRFIPVVTMDDATMSMPTVPTLPAPEVATARPPSRLSFASASRRCGPISAIWTRTSRSTSG